MVRIRLRRTGKRNAACHRIVVCDGRSPRDGRFIETIGIYDPRHDDEAIDLERAEYWVSNGAQPSETVNDIIKRARAGLARDLAKERAAAKAAAAEAEAAAKAAAAAPAEEAAEVSGS